MQVAPLVVQVDEHFRAHRDERDHEHDEPEDEEQHTVAVSSRSLVVDDERGERIGGYEHEWRHVEHDNARAGEPRLHQLDKLHDNECKYEHLEEIVWFLF